MRLSHAIYATVAAAIIIAAILYYATPDKLPVIMVDTVEEAIQYAALDTEITIAGQPYIATVSSDSMRPYLIPFRSYYGFTRTPFLDVQEGQAIAYSRPGEPGSIVVHFATGRDADNNITTKGSRNKGADNYSVTPGEYIATVKRAFTAREE